jgi:hypothetical protein
VLRRQLINLALFSGCALFSHPSFADELKPFEASYDWSWHGMTVAVSTLHLEHQDGENWVYRSNSEPRGLGRMFSERPTQTSVMKISDAGVHPVTYKADDGTSATKRDADVKFDWEHNRVTGVYEDKHVDMEMPKEIQDDLSVQIALMVELLRGHTPEKFSLLSGDSVREYRYSRDGEETLNTPMGKIQTVIFRSEKQYSPRVTRFWCAPSLGYIPLRVQQKRKDDVEWTMQVQSVKR